MTPDNKQFSIQNYFLRSIFFIFLLMYSAAAYAQSSKLNILLILVDDLGYGDLACYGNPYISTPNLDRLAGEGMRFTNFYSPSPLCSPSRAGILTGRTPYRSGIKSWIPEGEDIYLHEQEITLATLLKKEGYQTFMAGKWHLNGGLGQTDHPQPQDHGFDKWLALHAFAIPNHKNPTNFFEDGKPLGNTEGFTAQLVIDKSIDYLEQRDKSKPFFLYVPMVEPHSQIASPDSFNRMYSAFTHGKIDISKLEDRSPGEYYANVTYMDYQIGRLLDKLERMDLRDNTLVIFLSDNGPVTNQWRYWWEVNMYGSTGGLRGRKADLYEGGIRVPCIIRFPGKIKAGSVSDEPLHGYDLLPTVCGILDIPIPDDREIDGIDFSPLFDNQKIERDKPLFWAFETRPADDPEGYVYAVRDGDWKLISDESLNRSLLYNLKEDPYEVKEVSRQHPDVVARLERSIRDIKKSIADDPLRPESKPPSVREVTLLYTNDIESVYDPIDAYWDNNINHIGGIPHLAALIKQMRKKENLTFLFDSGDIFTGALSKATRGALPFDLYNAMGYEAMALGNHEFEYGWQKLLDVKQRARFPVLNANIFYKNTDIHYAQSYTILEKQGVRIGVIGVMGLEAFKNTILPDNVKELEARDPVPIVQKLVDKLRDDVDLIVLLTHQNRSAPMQSDKEADPEVQRGFDEDYALAGRVKGIDVILGGHSDNGLWEPVRHPQNGTLISMTFGQGKYLGYMKLRINKTEQRVDLLDGKLLPVVSDKIAADPDIFAMIEKARKKYSHLSKVIGYNEKTGYRKYYRESNLGNFLADALKEASGAEIAMVNPGSIRADLNTGPITKEELDNIYPFVDNLVIVEISGTALQSLIEYSLELVYGLVQFSGLRLKYDSSRPVGQRLIEASVNGKPLDPNKNYTIACSYFLATGGDGFTMLKNGKRLAILPKIVVEYIADYIKTRKTITMPDVGRQIDIARD
ncbi:MAG TPA: hypothetical protein ENK44_09725 [Caldithrix abyssi]|uniref:Arylsulfatase n=1 Tax=Caldithrix abyssi TaxID=187145 RepID=A0A7V4WV90_CALAY|nr:hypothetical protein [Caldithrix abyssi]